MKAEESGVVESGSGPSYRVGMTGKIVYEAGVHNKISEARPKTDTAIHDMRCNKRPTLNILGGG